jgi:hypothetical protein
LVPVTSEPILPSTTPGPRSCEEVEGTCLELTFDGENCAYKGPEEIKAGHVTFLFRTESELPACGNLVRHLGDATAQDMIDFLGEEDARNRWPSWALNFGARGWAYPGKRHIWEGVLKPGIHTMHCLTDRPVGLWFGGELMVED